MMANGILKTPIIAPISGAPCAPPTPSDGSLQKISIIPYNGVIYSPFSGILRQADANDLSLLIEREGSLAAELRLVGASGTPLSPAPSHFLLLAECGTRLARGQVVAHVDLSALRRRGDAPILLLTLHGAPHLPYKAPSGSLKGGSTPIFGDERAFSKILR